MSSLPDNSQRALPTAPKGCQTRLTDRTGGPAIQTVSLSVFRFDRRRDRLWALGQMALARRDFAAMDGCSFWKLCGSGTGEGFTPRPNTAVWAILAVWNDPCTARDRVAQAPVFDRWRDRAGTDLTLFLSPVSATGAWSGREPFHPGPSGPGPLAALTRARIRGRHLRRFWGRVPDISERIGADPNVLFKIGIGEVPWRNQITFSVWPDAEAMARFARTGPHAEAIRAVRENGWFSEELYARFRVTGESGAWDGIPRLAPTAEAA